MGKKDYSLIALFLFMLFSFIVIFNIRIKNENSRPIESRIAGEYCKNLSIKDGDEWDKCYNDVIKNVSVRFSELEECKKESKDEWSSGDWKNCYESKGWGL